MSVCCLIFVWYVSLPLTYCTYVYVIDIRCQSLLVACNGLCLLPVTLISSNNKTGCYCIQKKNHRYGATLVAYITEVEDTLHVYTTHNPALLVESKESSFFPKSGIIRYLHPTTHRWIYANQIDIINADFLMLCFVGWVCWKPITPYQILCGAPESDDTYTVCLQKCSFVLLSLVHIGYYLVQFKMYNKTKNQNKHRNLSIMHFYRWL